MSLHAPHAHQFRRLRIESTPASIKRMLSIDLPVLRVACLASNNYVGRELRARRVSNAVVTVGFACFGMNLVGVDIEGRPCTPVFTYANSSPKLADVVKRLRHALDTTGNNREGVQEEFRQRTGAPVHVSYAAAALLQWLAVTATTSAPSPEHKVEQKRAEGERESDWRNDGYFDADSGCAKAANHSLSSTGDARNVKVWQTLPSLIAARWCGMTSAPVSYSEASWMGLLDFRKLEVGNDKVDIWVFTLAIGVLMYFLFCYQ